MSSDTLQVLMFVCPNISELRFYGCCHPCFHNPYPLFVMKLKLIVMISDILIGIQSAEVISMDRLVTGTVSRDTVVY